MTLRLTLFGGINITVNNQTPNLQTDKTAALLVYLALSGRQSHTRSALAFLLWPDMPDSQARTNLRVSLSRLRSGLDSLQPGLSDALLAATRNHIQWLSSPNIGASEAVVWTDVLEFQALAGETAVHRHETIEGCPLCTARLAQASNLYQGDLLAGFTLSSASPFDEWATQLRERLHRQALEMLDILIVAGQLSRRLSDVIKYARRALTLESWREESHRALLAALLQAGQRDAALSHLESYRETLRAEWKSEPAPDILALFGDIRGDAAAEQGDSVRHFVQPRSGPLAGLPSPTFDLSGAPTVDALYGRDAELGQLIQFLAPGRRRIVAVVGIGGVGKTTLTAYALRRILPHAAPHWEPSGRGEEDGLPLPVRGWQGAHFEGVLWRSVLNAPPAEQIVRSWLQTLSGQAMIHLPDELDDLLTSLFVHLRRKPTLLILDNLESLLEPGQEGGHFRAGHEAYDQLIRRMGETDHVSCLLLTSRESPRSLGRVMRSHRRHIHILQLDGIPLEAGRQILADRAVCAAEEDAQQLVARYSGNPLALELVAETIDEHYSGEANAFLADNAALFEDIRDVLAHQTARLSQLEKDLLLWLAVERDPATQKMLTADLSPRVTTAELLAALRSLERRSLLQRRESDLGVRFTLQNVLLEFQTERHIDRFCTALEQQNLARLSSHALLKTQSEEYVIQSQRRTLLQPVVERLEAKWGRAHVARRLRDVLDQLRALPEALPGYAAGNVVNLLIHLGVDLRGLNLAGLEVREVDLRGIPAHDWVLAGAHLHNCAFTDTFGGVFTVALSPDGRYLAASTKNGELCLWRIADGQPVARVIAHSGTAWSVAFDPGGTWIASCGADGFLRLWRAQLSADAHASQDLILAGTMEAHANPARCVAFSPDGALLASAGEDGYVCLWNYSGLVEESQIDRVARFEHGGRVFRVVFSPDGDYLASAGADERILIWQIDRRNLSVRCVQELRGHKERIAGLAFSSDNRTLASGCVDTTVRLWEWRSGVCRQELARHRDAVLSVAFSPDGQTLATTGHGGAIRFWQIGADGSAAASKILEGHEHGVWSLAFSADGQLLASGSETDQQVRLWQVGSGSCRRAFPSQVMPVTELAFHPDRPLLVTGSYSGALHLWDIDNRRQVQRVGASAGHTKDVSGLACFPGSDIVASGGREGEIKLWRLGPHADEAIEFMGTLGRHQGWVTALAISPDGRQVASASLNGNIRLWTVDAEDPTRLAAAPPRILAGHQQAVWSLSYSLDNRMLISTGDDGQVRIWDTDSGEVRARFGSAELGQVTAAISPDSRWIAMGDANGYIRLWHVSQSRVAMEFLAHDGRVTCVAFTPDGRVLASSSLDGELALWPVAELANPSHTPDFLHRFQGHSGPIYSISISTDGDILASASDDGSIRLWDVETDENLSIVRPEGLYAGMDIGGVTGIAETQKASLRALDAVG